MAIKHLYIHLPFCHQFCQYCDFLRIHYDPKHVDQYLQLIKQEIKSKHIKNKLKTIYLGGGTPNALNFAQLTELGKSVKNLIDHKTEFTIECNPEFISDEQVAIFKKIGINRVSLGTQIWDDQLLHKYGRNHTTQTVVKAVKILQSHQIKNISLDFIYGFNDLTNKQILKGILFAKTNAIKHLSFYALELKNSQLKQTNYVLNESLIEAQFKYIIKTLAKYGFMRYEVSN
jgi:oxygen-independent coproporphyrinogen-3 oxidase